MVWSCWLWFLVQETLKWLCSGLWSLLGRVAEQCLCVCVEILVSSTFTASQSWQGRAGGTGELCCDFYVLARFCL